MAKPSQLTVMRLLRRIMANPVRNPMIGAYPEVAAPAGRRIYARILE